MIAIPSVGKCTTTRIKVRDGIIEDPAFLPVIYAADETDDWTDEAVWAKAIRASAISIKLDYLRGECEKAKAIPAYENTFKRLHLNIWTEQESRWLQIETWDACNAAVPPLEALKGRRAWVGVDLSTTTDITAVVALVADPDDPDVFDVVPFFFVPAERIVERSRRDRVPYVLWRDQGYIDRDRRQYRRLRRRAAASSRAGRGLGHCRDPDRPLEFDRVADAAHRRWLCRRPVRPRLRVDVSADEGARAHAARRSACGMAAIPYCAGWRRTSR